jgi:1,6-anhydro-N-acetylmuramate kinase
MVYKIVSAACHSLNDGFSIGYAELQHQPGKWEYSNFIKSDFSYDAEWRQKLERADAASASFYFTLHNEFGNYLAETINSFIEKNNLSYKVQLISLKGFTVFAKERAEIELGNPGFIAAGTGINVIADFISINKGLGGNGNYPDAIAFDLLPAAEYEIRLALLAVLRWREENNFTAQKTGAARNSIGGAVWMGQEA